MKSLVLSIANYSLFILAAFILTSFQASLWLGLFGFFPSPQFWLALLAYWAIYRPTNEGLFMCFILALCVAPFTAMPLGISAVIHLILFSLIRVFRQRIFWRGATFFMVSCLMVTALYPMTHLLVSWVSEVNALSELEVIDWTLRALLTALIALPLFFLFNSIDRLTQKFSNQNIGADIL